MRLEKRRDRRYPYCERVTLTWGRREFVARSEDVSFNGLLVRTDAPIPERQLVRLSLRLAPDGAEIRLTGMVIRRTRWPRAEPGLAIVLYAVGTLERDRWERFVRLVGSRVADPVNPVRRAS